MNEKLQRAIEFAVRKHGEAGQVRKGTNVPYIVHPLEVVTILQRMNAGTELLCAGALHDTVEDTAATLEEIEAEFGGHVAELVAAHTEDKSRTWEERKQISNEHLQMASDEVRRLILADKLSNLRSIAADLRLQGDSEEYWQKYNRGRTAQSWYYAGAIDALDGMQENEETAWAYWELDALYKDTFVAFGFDPEQGILYQRAEHEDVFHMLRFNAPFWTVVKECRPGTIYEVSRAYVERLEEDWLSDMQFQSDGPVQ